MGTNRLSHLVLPALTLLLCVTLTGTMTGCYWGNREVDAPFAGPWYYETQMNSVQLCAQTQGQTTPSCATELGQTYLPQFSMPLASGLSLDLSRLSDPFVLSQLDAQDAAIVGAGFGFYNSDTGSLSFVANQSSTGAISYAASSEVSFYQDSSDNPICGLEINVSIKGQLTNAGPFNSYTANPLSGRLISTQTVSMTQVGTGCIAAEQCFNNGSLCTNNTKDTVGSVYGNFSSAGVLDLTAATPPAVTSLSYTIQYQ